MISLFGGNKPDHPMAELKEAKRLLEELPVGARECADELSHWLASVIAEEGFKPEYRVQLVQLLDETAQPHLRKLAREYTSSPRLAKAQELRQWKAIFECWRQVAQAYVSCVDLYASGVKGGESLKSGMPLLLARALRALAAQVKWLAMRYGPSDASVWSAIGKVYALAEARKFAQITVAPYPGIPDETTPEREFLKALMFSVSSPESLLPLEMELCERLIAHFCPAFVLSAEAQPGLTYSFDLSTSQAPARTVRVSAALPSLRLFAAGKALEDLEALRGAIRSSGKVPADVNLAGSYPAEIVLEVLEHLTIYWSSEPPQRRHQRHRVKSRLNVVHGYDGVAAMLGGAPEQADVETEIWIVENVSAGGFGAGVPEIKGDWLRIGVLLGMQPEGGDNWVLGVVRRLQREMPQKGSVGIQTIAKSAQLVELSLGAGGSEWGILIGADGQAPGEARVLLRPGVFETGQNMEYRRGDVTCLLMPQGVVQSEEDFDLVKFRELVRDDSD